MGRLLIDKFPDMPRYLCSIAGTLDFESYRQRMKTQRSYMMILVIKFSKRGEPCSNGVVGIQISASCYDGHAGMICRYSCNSRLWALFGVGGSRRGRPTPCDHPFKLAARKGDLQHAAACLLHQAMRKRACSVGPK